MLLRITAPHLCAGLVLKDDVVIEAAPILKYMQGWTYNKVLNYCWLKKWNIERVGDEDG